MVPSRLHVSRGCGASLASSLLSLTREGRVCYSFKTLRRDGSTHTVFEPLDFIARLVALILRSGGSLTRYYGVFAANIALRAAVMLSNIA